MKYLDGIPERFYSQESRNAYGDLIDREFTVNPARLIKVLNENADDIDRAILTLNEVGREDWHDAPMEDEEYAFMRLCDRRLHPAYLKLAEGVLHRLIYPLAVCLRLERNKSATDLWKLSACIEEMKRASCSLLVAHCDSIVRNNIAHGRVTYRQKEVVYADRDGSSRIHSNRTVMEMVDGLMDTCQGCALSLKMFYRLHLRDGIEVPRQVMLEELQADTETPWWHVEGCLVSELAGKSQLVVYARPGSGDIHKIQYMILYSGILAEHFAPGFDRYMISLRSPTGWPGFAALDGRKLRDIRMSSGPRSLGDYANVVESNFVFYKPKIALPRLLCRLETLLMSFRLHMPLAWDDMQRTLQRIRVTARRAEIHRNGWRTVVNGCVVVDVTGERNPKEAVRQARKRIIRATKRLGRKNLKWHNIAKYLPVGYARVGVFEHDRRCRQLYGLDSDLVGTVQIQSIPRIKAPDIAGSTIETVGRYRIAWNRAWLDRLQT
ncbi:MAG: hypothetical protein JW993_06605 [Sedimentisphaerales bacterium]|nr:hypothetical protein [Sedimentisphaerales bacterium]